MARFDRDGRPQLRMPLHQPPSVSLLIAQRIAALFVVPAVLLLVGWVVGGGR